MPRKLTDAEIDAQKEFMYERTVSLISKKDISTITLDDILDAVQMAKGSFYRLYRSKEEFLYEVIKKNERIFFDKTIRAVPQIQLGEDAALKTMSDLLLNRGFLFLYLPPEDVERLLRKMPPDYRKQEEEKSQNNFLSFCQAMKINPTAEFFGTLSYLMEALQTVVTSPDTFGESGQKRAVIIMMQAIYALIMEESVKNGGQ